MSATVQHAGQSDTGRMRSENEDRFFADPKQGLYLVTDGIGGAAAGGLAAEIVVQALPSLVSYYMTGLADLAAPKARERLHNVLCRLSNQLRDESQEQPGLAGMGATLILLLIRNNQALLAHMGDSRAYRLHDEHLEQLTVDHTVAQLLVESGDIALEEVAAHPARSTLTRFVGMKGEALPEVQFQRLCPGDRLLLCSDGLTDMVDEDELSAILSAPRAPNEVCSTLIDAANAAGGRDNITALVLHLAGDEVESTQMT